MNQLIIGVPNSHPFKHTNRGETKWNDQCWLQAKQMHNMFCCNFMSAQYCVECVKCQSCDIAQLQSLLKTVMQRKRDRRYLDATMQFLVHAECSKKPAHCEISRVGSWCQGVHIQGPWRILRAGAVGTPQLALLCNSVYSEVFSSFFYHLKVPSKSFIVSYSSQVPNIVQCGLNKLRRKLHFFSL